MAYNFLPCDRDQAYLLSPFLNIFVSKELNDIENHFKSLGYYVLRSNSLTISVVDGQFRDKNIIAWAFGGHGIYDNNGNSNGQIALSRFEGYASFMGKSELNYKIAEMILYSCGAGIGNWKEHMVSSNGVLRATKETIRAIAVQDNLV